MCIDIDECSSEALNYCHHNATCSDTLGSFQCNCRDGFTGDGINCNGMSLNIILHYYRRLGYFQVTLFSLFQLVAVLLLHFNFFFNKRQPHIPRRKKLAQKQHIHCNKYNSKKEPCLGTPSI